MPQRWIQTRSPEAVRGGSRPERILCVPSRRLGVQAGPEKSLRAVRPSPKRSGRRHSGGGLPLFPDGGDELGRQSLSRRTFRPAKARSRRFWCGVQVPVECPPGLYEGDVAVSAEGLAGAVVPVRLDRRRRTRPVDHGDSDPFRMTRLRWLDSTLAQDHDVVKPFTPLEVKGRTIKCLGREVELGRKRSARPDPELFFAGEHTTVPTRAATSWPGRCGSLSKGPRRLR